MNKTLLLFGVFSACVGVIASSCSKDNNTKATTSVVQMSYSGVNHIFNTTGLNTSPSLSTIEGSELGTPSTMVLTYTGFGKGTYRMGPTSQSQLSLDISGKVYSSGRNHATGVISINKIDTLFTTVYGTFSGSLVNLHDSTDILEVGGGSISVKY